MVKNKGTSRHIRRVLKQVEPCCFLGLFGGLGSFLLGITRYIIRLRHGLTSCRKNYCRRKNRQGCMKLVQNM